MVAMCQRLITRIDRTHGCASGVVLLRSCATLARSGGRAGFVPAASLFAVVRTVKPGTTAAERRPPRSGLRHRLGADGGDNQNQPANLHPHGPRQHSCLQSIPRSSLRDHGDANFGYPALPDCAGGVPILRFN